MVVPEGPYHADALPRYSNCTQSFARAGSVLSFTTENLFEIYGLTRILYSKFNTPSPS